MGDVTPHQSTAHSAGVDIQINLGLLRAQFLWKAVSYQNAHRQLVSNPWLLRLPGTAPHSLACQSNGHQSIAAGTWETWKLAGTFNPTMTDSLLIHITMTAPTAYWVIHERASPQGKLSMKYVQLNLPGDQVLIQHRFSNDEKCSTQPVTFHVYIHVVLCFTQTIQHRDNISRSLSCE